MPKKPKTKSKSKKKPKVKPKNKLKLKIGSDSKIKPKKKPNPKGGPVTKERKAAIFDQLTKMVESGQLIGANHIQLAELFGIRRQTIAEYLKKIYGTIPPEDLNITRVKIQVMFDKLFREVQNMIKVAKGFREKREAIELMLKMVDRFTAFLENFHIKTKAVDNINLGGEVDNKIEIVIVKPDYAAPKVIDVKQE